MEKYNLSPLKNRIKSPSLSGTLPRRCKQCDFRFRSIAINDKGIFVRRSLMPPRAIAQAREFQTSARGARGVHLSSARLSMRNKIKTLEMFI